MNHLPKILFSPIDYFSSFVKNLVNDLMAFLLMV